MNQSGIPIASSDEHWRVDTPENVIFDYPIAGIGSRFLAALVDTLLIALLQVLVNSIIVVALASVQMIANVDQSFIPQMWIIALLGLISFAFLWGYYVFFEMIWNGQSPGKRWVGLRVIRTDGMPITLTESVIRNLVRLVDFLPVYYGVGIVAMFANEQARRLGDLAAGTLVVWSQAPVTLEALSSQAYPTPGPTSPPDWPLERLNAQDIEMAEDFLRRRFELTDRANVGARIARVLLAKMDIPAEAALADRPAEDILKGIVRSKMLAK